jgi:hypothetical protein
MRAYHTSVACDQTRNEQTARKVPKESNGPVSKHLQDAQTSVEDRDGGVLLGSISEFVCLRLGLARNRNEWHGETCEALAEAVKLHIVVIVGVLSTSISESLL